MHKLRNSQLIGLIFTDWVQLSIHIFEKYQFSFVHWHRHRFKTCFTLCEMRFQEFLPVPSSVGRPWDEPVCVGGRPCMESWVLDALSSTGIFTSMPEKRWAAIKSSALSLCNRQGHNQDHRGRDNQWTENQTILYNRYVGKKKKIESPLYKQKKKNLKHNMHHSFIDWEYWTTKYSAQVGNHNGNDEHRLTYYNLHFRPLVGSDSCSNANSSHH